MCNTSSNPLNDDACHQRINEILNTKKVKPDFDLDELVAHIERLLAHYKNHQGRRSSTDENLAFSEQVSRYIEKIARQISKSSGTTISVLAAMANVPWVGVGLLLVATALQRVDKIKTNKRACLALLESMNELAKVIKDLKKKRHSLARKNREMKEDMNKSIELIVNGAMLCCSQTRIKVLTRLCHASSDGEKIEEIRLNVEERRRIIQERINSSRVHLLIC